MGVEVKGKSRRLDYMMNVFSTVSLYMSIRQIHPDIVVSMGSDVRRTGIWCMIFRNDPELETFLQVLCP